MLPHSTDFIRATWVRWLAWHGLPPDHVARVLAYPAEYVSARWPAPMPDRVRSPRSRQRGRVDLFLPQRLRPRARALAELGYPVRLIARILGVGTIAVDRVLSPPVLDLRRRIKGPLASAVKDRHLAGESAEAIAEVLQLEPDNVRAYLARTLPPPPPPAPPPGPQGQAPPMVAGG
jgi:hypothetical protein